MTAAAMLGMPVEGHADARLRHGAGLWARLAAELRPGGRLKISVPAQGGGGGAGRGRRRPHADRRAALDPAFPLEHVNAFSVAGLEALGSRFGLARVRPTLGQRFVFLRHRGVLPFHPRDTAKELGRPFVPYEGARNLTVWLRAAG